MGEVLRGEVATDILEVYARAEPLLRLCLSHLGVGMNGVENGEPRMEWNERRMGRGGGVFA